MTGPFDQLAAALAAGPTVRTIGLDRTPRGERSAAVLMLLTEAADPEVTFVTRAETLRRHAGQVALPGGAVDPGDESRFATALREAHEEIGLDPLRARLFLARDEETEAVHAENLRAHRLGINGVPCLVIGGRNAIAGAQDQEVLARLLDVAAVEAALGAGIGMRPSA